MKVAVRVSFSSFLRLDRERFLLLRGLFFFFFFPFLFAWFRKLGNLIFQSFFFYYFAILFSFLWNCCARLKKNLSFSNNFTRVYDISSKDSKEKQRDKNKIKHDWKKILPLLRRQFLKTVHLFPGRFDKKGEAGS